MAKKKSKKISKPVESLSPPDSAPAPVPASAPEQPTPVVPEVTSVREDMVANGTTSDDQPAAEYVATERAPGHQSHSTSQEAGITITPTIDDSHTSAASATSPHPEDSRSVTEEAEQVPVHIGDVTDTALNANQVQPDERKEQHAEPPEHPEQEGQVQQTVESTPNISDEPLAESETQDLPSQPTDAVEILSDAAAHADLALPAQTLPQEEAGNTTTDNSHIEPIETVVLELPQDVETAATGSETHLVPQSTIAAHPASTEQNNDMEPLVEEASLASDLSSQPVPEDALPDTIAPETAAESLPLVSKKEKPRQKRERLAREKKQREENERLETESRHLANPEQQDSNDSQRAPDAQAEIQESNVGDEQEGALTTDLPANKEQAALQGLLEREEQRRSGLQQQEQKEAERLQDENREATEAAAAAAEEEALVVVARQREEQRRLELEHIEQEMLTQQRLEQEAKEAAELFAKEEEDRIRLEELEQERLRLESLEQEKLAQEILKKEEEQQLELSRLERARHEVEENERKAQELKQFENEKLEQKAREAAEAAEKAQREAEEAEAVRKLAEQALREPVPVLNDVDSPYTSEIGIKTSSEPRFPSDMEAPMVQQTEMETIPSKPHVLVKETPQMHSPEPILGPDTSPTRAMSPPSNMASEPSAAPSPPGRSAHIERTQQHANFSNPPATEGLRRKAHNSDPIHAPRPQAVAQLIEDNRPPAPSPPVGRLRPRYVTHS